MANEHILVFETEKPIPFTCADSGGIEKGTVLKLADPFTASASAGAVDVIAGILAEEKVTLDGKIKIPVYRGGIFKAVASGAITVGNAICSKGSANLVIAAAINDENILGIALETAAEAESILYELKPVVMNLA